MAGSNVHTVFTVISNPANYNKCPSTYFSKSQSCVFFLSMPLIKMYKYVYIFKKKNGS